MLRAVLFDIGGPLDTEAEYDRLVDQAIRSELVHAGIAVDDAAYARAARAAVDSFAPNAYQAIVWQLSGHQPELSQRVYAAVARQLGGRSAIELRAGMPEVLRALREHGLLLGVVANQPARAEGMLKRAGIGQFFQYLGISEALGLRKPDPRIFLAACQALQVQPEECLMVGDRIDNDIVPARLLGMRTVLWRTGRHVDQQPRSWLEVADVEVSDVHGLRAAIARAVEP